MSNPRIKNIPTKISLENPHSNMNTFPCDNTKVDTLCPTQIPFCNLIWFIFHYSFLTSFSLRNNRVEQLRITGLWCLKNISSSGILLLVKLILDFICKSRYKACLHSFPFIYNIQIPKKIRSYYAIFCIYQSVFCI